MKNQQLILIAAAGILIGLWWTRSHGQRVNLNLGLQQRVNASGLPVGFGAAPVSHFSSHGIFSFPGPVNTWSLI